VNWWLVAGVVVAVLVVLAVVKGPLIERGLDASRRRASRLAERDRERARELGNPVPPPPPHERDGWS